MRNCLLFCAVVLLAETAHAASVGKEPAKAQVETGSAAKPSPSPTKDVKPAATVAKPTGSTAKPAEPTAKPGDSAVKPVEKPTDKPGVPAAVVDPDDTAAVENAEAEGAALAKPVNPEPVQIYGWREYVMISGVAGKFNAKLDTGACTSSIHAEEKELFERDGKKWVRFIVTDPTVEKPVRTRIEAPLVRIAMIKEPAAESTAREVVRLGFQIGDRKLRGEFTLNNRKNMLAPVLVGRALLKELGMVDPGRVHLADQKIFR